MNTIKVNKNDTAAFTAYVNSIKWTLSPEQKTTSGATKLYEDWKAKQTPVKTTTQSKTAAQIAAEKAAKEKAEKDALTETVRAKAEANKIAKENEIKDKTDIANTAQNKFVEEWALWKWSWNTAYQDSMNTTIKNIKDLWAVDLEQKNTEVQQTAQRKADILKWINEPAIEAYNKSTQEFLKLIDWAIEQNKSSVESKRKIADSLREAAWVEALIASNNALPWLSNNQKQALARDVSQWYQQAIAQAEWDYETARTIWWDKIKSLWIEWKNAMDIFTNTSKILWAEIAEPLLTALATQSTNAQEFIKKTNDFLLWTQTKQYADSEWKLIATQWQTERSLNYAKQDAAGKRAQINQALMQDWINLTIEPRTMDKLINYYWNNWDSIYRQLWYIASLDTTKRAAIINAVWKEWVSLEKVLTELNKTWVVSSENNIDQSKQWQQTAISEVNTWIKPTSTTDVNKLNYWSNKEKLDAANKKVQDATINQYNVFINWLSTKNKESIDRVKAYTWTKKEEAINKIKNSNYTQLQKDALIYYINK